ncbi:uncharacterized protein SCDLUD_000249 [Saccharomycodes ludwigii]|uniref:uncharacterized protein n=1 Tax=Saccharomycodes ludwigii TaxID=36035 RepID=UPI001E8A28D7|nr:hypothetical protein SCDLUD_000249 [Saccharomycodes ludwigii]KAH3902666.1 hypothetical protein SCDLUD_000249 [Saccharomycodes ludwigii]
MSTKSIVPREDIGFQTSNFENAYCKQRHSKANSSPSINITNDVAKVAEVLDIAFAHSPQNDYCLKKFFNIPLTQKCSRERIKSILYYYTAMYNDMGGEIVEVNNFDAVALFSKPGDHIDFDLTKDQKFNKTWFDDLDQVLEKILPDINNFYYLYMIGKNLTQKNVRGSVRKIFETYKEKADKLDVPIVLEAISEHARSVYEYFGFKNYYTFRYGDGEVDSLGNLSSSGEGFVSYLMVYYNKPLLVDGPIHDSNKVGEVNGFLGNSD